MYRKVWEHCKSSVCSIDFISNAGTKIISFTGFKVKNYLVTDDVIDKFEKPAEILIRFSESSSAGSGRIKMSYKEFLGTRVDMGNTINPGFLLFNIDKAAFRKVPALKCSCRIDNPVGHPIAVLGYQLDQDNLSIKAGIISSLFTYAVVSRILNPGGLLPSESFRPVVLALIPKPVSELSLVSSAWQAR